MITSKCKIALHQKKEKSYIRDPTHYKFSGLLQPMSIHI